MKRLILIVFLLLLTATSYGVDIPTHVALADSATGSVRSSTVLWTWLFEFIDSCTATPPHATLADTTNGGAQRAESSKVALSADVVLWSWLGGVLDTTTLVIQTDANVAVSDSTALEADSCLGGAVRAETAKIAEGAGIFDADSIVAITVTADTLKGVEQIGTEADLVLDANGIWYLKVDTPDSAVASIYAVKSTVSTGVKYKTVDLRTVHGQRNPTGMDVILSLESFLPADSLTYLFLDSSNVADGYDTVYLSALIPAEITQAESLIIIFNTSSATETTSKIDLLGLTVTGGGGITRRAWDYEFTTDTAATAITRWAISLSSDADFNSGEIVNLRFIDDMDANAWVKVYRAWLLCK